ncbi:Serine/threonine protein kinase [Saccharopolyspora antimicrobica]|uniref:non-specific serine/threonine protein kinase n=1 Tax=Saccharopolyspora antimicrobica TaxID=455193 RepID=A0A1I5HDL8_9PSEU|nr:serine/threonine-protein kinase [Saccharopolyspora antimicrobica]RKT85355.1 serine/threonine protein kinase [Saccharopolyspora antimicrobica]SFO46355.1 Serine/threonine protein kinase [Saccharopolyspora antimicrobica]
MPANDNNTLAGAGRLIGDRYRLERKLGGGAMGTVWAGTDELLRRPVAVKEVKLPPGMPDEEAAEMRERALREARAIAVLSHPNVVTLYDVARDGGEPFVVMELVPSQSLAAILEEHGALDDQQIAVIVDGVAAGLDAAHQAGIVHRDVKPGNVLIGDDGRIKVSDFGISRNIAEHTLTSTGILLGTPAYIAPEVAAGEGVRASADLWGLGATMFAVVEGRAPYDVGDDPLATVTEVVRGPVPRVSRSGPIGEIITGLMVKDPTRRMSLTEVRRRVQHLLPPPGARPFAMLLDPEAPTVRVRSLVPPTPSNPPPPRPKQPTLGAQAAPLARDPGLPPFELKDPPPSRRSPWSAVALGVAAVVLFAAALAGGFVLTRLALGKDVLPEPGTPASPAAETPLAEQLGLVETAGNAKHTAAPSGGKFQILAPQASPGGWQTFQSERTDVANSLVTSYVSPDGLFEIAVQRYGNFFGSGHDIDDYLDRLPLSVGGGNKIRVDSVTDNGDGKRLVYTTMVRPMLNGQANADPRTTEAELVRRDDDLWIVRVTGPPGLSTQSQAMLNEIAPTLDTSTP